jgi:hypothetical protein
VDPDKPGRPRNERTHRNRKPPQPLTTELDNGPGSDRALPDAARAFGDVGLGGPQRVDLEVVVGAVAKQLGAARRPHLSAERLAEARSTGSPRLGDATSCGWAGRSVSPDER